MVEISNTPYEDESDEISMTDLISKAKELFTYLKSKWLIIVLVGSIFGGIGYAYAYFQKPDYIGSLSFALEDEKSGGGLGLAGALGIASSLGIDLGNNAGGAFSGANLTVLMKSRTLVEKALLNPIIVDKKERSLATYFIEFNNLDKAWKDNPVLSNIKFDPNSDRSKYTLQQDSILGKLYDLIAGEDGTVLSIDQKDKKVSILTIEVKSKNELFSKYFTESIAKEVSEFYVDSKSKKSKLNVSILQKQADSVRNELNSAINGVAVANDNTYNLNPALVVRKTPSARRQVDVQANTAILTQLVTNLELAKVTLMKETPLIQVIDKPILPLKKVKQSKIKSFIIFGFFAGLICVITLLVKRKR
jgi:hypothetical protein